MSKAERIRRLYARGLDVAEIAAEVGCSPNYVRVCARQRIGGRASDADRRYLAKGDRAMARSKARDAYRAARRTGQGVEMAKRAWRRAYAWTCSRPRMEA